jgi:hypothetical protein
LGEVTLGGRTLSDNKHILEEAKLFLGTHKYLKWPTLTILAIIGGLLLSKQLGESVDYWLTKLKLVGPASTKPNEPNEAASGSNVALKSQATESRSASKGQPPVAQSTTSKISPLPATLPSSPVKPTSSPKTTKSADVQSGSKKDKTEKTEKTENLKGGPTKSTSFDDEGFTENNVQNKEEKTETNNESNDAFDTLMSVVKNLNPEQKYALMDVLMPEEEEEINKENSQENQQNI